MSKIPYVLKTNYLQVVVDGQPFSLDSTHPTFARLKNAIKKRKWGLVPKLVTLAQSLTFDTHGDVSVIKGVVYYKGKQVESSLTQRIVAMIKKGQPVKHMLHFMDNLYKNQSKTAISEFYDWLLNNDLPITDNGCFLAYKSVNDNYTDTHSGTVSNKPGQVIMMPRKLTQNDYNTQCATGFHVCSKQYGIYGSKVMAVMVNPKDVISAVSGKMRVTKYEVLMELGRKYTDFTEDVFKEKGIASIEGKLVVEIKKERQELIKLLLKNILVKKLLRRKKITKTTITKAAYARLKSMAQKYNAVPKIGPEADFSLKKAREAAGLSIGQVAKATKTNYKQVVYLERSEQPAQTQIDAYLQAIAKLTETRNYAVTYPKPMAHA